MTPRRPRAPWLPFWGPQTPVLSLQNGVDGWRRIGGIAGEERVLGGIALLPAAMRKAAVVRHNGGFAKVKLGEFDGRLSERIEAVERELNVPGLDAHAVADISVQVWEKFIMLSTLSGITGLTRLPIGSILADRLCSHLYQRALEEAAEVGLKSCAELPKDVAARQMEFSRALPPAVKASMLYDLEHGKRIELNDLSGAVVRLGRELGVATPVHAVIHAALQPYVMGRP